LKRLSENGSLFYFIAKYGKIMK